jgi:hypothetical protein
MDKKTICIDFDGVIHDYSQGWQGEDVFGQMIPNADTATQVLKKKGWQIIIFTTRKKTKKLEDWLQEHKIAYDHINENPDQPEHSSDKIVADVYLDDRGICFRGRWDEWLIREILDFEPWQEQEKKRMESLANFKDNEDDIWARGKEKRIKLCDSCC